MISEVEIITEGEWSSAESLDNHIVAIVRDHGQGEDLIVTEESAYRIVKMNLSSLKLLE